MIPAPRTFWMISLAVIFFIGTAGCGQKHLSVSTSSGQDNQQEELEASLEDSPSAQTGIQDSSVSETGLGSELASQDSTDQENTTDQETVMVIEPPPLPTIRGDSAEESLDTSGTAGLSTATGTGEGIQHHPYSGDEEEISAPPAYQTALEPGDGGPLVPFGSSAEEEFGALVQPTPDQGEMMESPHVERVPENIVIAKVESSDAVDQQLARIKEDELATAAPVFRISILNLIAGRSRKREKICWKRTPICYRMIPTRTC